MKQALVVAGVKDINRPAEKLSTLQSGGGRLGARRGRGKKIGWVLTGGLRIAAIVGRSPAGARRGVGLAATGLIWSRYATQIIPVNYSLLTVNLFVAATGLYQCYRIWEYVSLAASARAARKV